MRKLLTFSSLGRLGIAVALTLLLQAAVAFAQPNNGSNAPINSIPTLDGVGLATLAGGLAMVGSWAMARARRKK